MQLITWKIIKVKAYEQMSTFVHFFYLLCELGFF